MEVVSARERDLDSQRTIQSSILTIQIWFGGSRVFDIEDNGLNNSFEENEQVLESGYNENSENNPIIYDGNI